MKTLGLADFDLDAKEFGQAVIERYRSEQESVDEARCKARAVT